MEQLNYKEIFKAGKKTPNEWRDIVNLLKLNEINNGYGDSNNDTIFPHVIKSSLYEEESINFCKGLMYQEVPNKYLDAYYTNPIKYVFFINQDFYAVTATPNYILTNIKDESWDWNGRLNIHYNMECLLSSVTLTEPKLAKSFNFAADERVVNSPDELRELAIQKLGEYGSKWLYGIENEIYTNLRNHNDYPYVINYLFIILHPEVELLHKMGYKFIEPLLRYPDYTNKLGKNTNDWYHERSLRYISDELTRGYPMYKRLCQNGTSPKDIFKLPTWFMKEYKECANITEIDTARKLFTLRGVTQDGIRQLNEMNLSKRDLNYFDDILRQKYEDKPIFTLTSLVNFLNRIDMFQAISRYEGLQLLKDYLMMCKQLNIEPNIDSDSLKREHDVAARNLRLKKDEVFDAQIREVSTGLYNYSDDEFVVREIISHEDLLDEANQQSNCLACYARRIIEKSSLIYVMRKVETPNKSLISIELSPDGKEIRQKLLAYNHNIHDTNQSRFIKKWQDHIKEVNIQNNISCEEE